MFNLLLHFYFFHHIFDLLLNIFLPASCSCPMDVISFLFEGNIFSKFCFFFHSLYYLYFSDFLFLFVLILFFRLETCF